MCKKNSGVDTCYVGYDHLFFVNKCRPEIECTDSNIANADPQVTLSLISKNIGDAIGKGVPSGNLKGLNGVKLLVITERSRLNKEPCCDDSN